MPGLTIIEERFYSAAISFFNKNRRHTKVKIYTTSKVGDVTNIEKQINEDMTKKVIIDIKVSDSSGCPIFTVLYQDLD